jgi:hypothetical protein
MTRKKVKPEFDVDYDPDDVPAGGGIPDDDGMVYLRRSRGKENANGKSKAGRAVKAKGKPVEDRPG